MADTHQWIAQVTGDIPPPPDIPWMWIAIGGAIIGAAAIGLSMKKENKT